jgi:imidazolonepropionase
MEKKTLTGPFRQVVTMDAMPVKGPLHDNQLHIIEKAWILIQEGKIVAIGSYHNLKSEVIEGKDEIQQIQGDHVALPGMIDPHTHICWAGSRSNDYALRLSGMSYLDIASGGGGIWSTVTNTRNASDETLYQNTRNRASSLLKDGVTTVEVKSGYALNVEDELRMLEAIHKVNSSSEIDIVPTCLAAHTLPKDFQGSAKQYLELVTKKLLPEVVKRKLSSRADIYIEKNAFSADEGLFYLNEAKSLGFDAVVHADQFSTGGTEVAVSVDAISADHLEVSTGREIAMIAGSDVIPVVLPGASIGLGADFAPARKILDAGCSLAVASDWNPGSAPGGDMLVQACILGVYERLTMAETIASISCRAAAALKLHDRGILKKGNLADIIAFPVSDYRDIVYFQGKVKPDLIMKRGKLIYKP